MPDFPVARVMTRDEFEAMVLDDLHRPPGKDPWYVIATLLVRDGGICGLCRTVVGAGPWERYDPAKPQADHIIERSRGGAHSWGNLRLAHGFCNNYRNNYPGVRDVPEEKFRKAFERAVHEWANPHIYLPRAIAWDESLIADYGAKAAKAEAELRELVTARADDDSIAGAAREAAHWNRLLKNKRTHLATLNGRVARHLARLGVPGQDQS